MEERRDKGFPIFPGIWGPRKSKGRRRMFGGGGGEGRGEKEGRRDAVEEKDERKGREESAAHR